MADVMMHMPLAALIAVYGRDEQWYWGCQLCTDRMSPREDSDGWVQSRNLARAMGMLHLFDVHQAQ